MLVASTYGRTEAAVWTSSKVGSPYGERWAGSGAAAGWGARGSYVGEGVAVGRVPDLCLPGPGAHAARIRHSSACIMLTSSTSSGW